MASGTLERLHLVVRTSYVIDLSADGKSSKKSWKPDKECRNARDDVRTLSLSLVFKSATYRATAVILPFIVWNPRVSRGDYETATGCLPIVPYGGKETLSQKCLFVRACWSTLFSVVLHIMVSTWCTLVW